MTARKRSQVLTSAARLAAIEKEIAARFSDSPDLMRVYSTLYAVADELTSRRMAPDELHRSITALAHEFANARDEEWQRRRGAAR